MKLDKPQNGTGAWGKSGLSTKIMNAYLPIVHSFAVTCSYNLVGHVTVEGIILLQWNLRKWTPPITETSTMRTRVRGPKLYSIILQLL